jgi:hypothetical protein
MRVSVKCPKCAAKITPDMTFAIEQKKCPFCGTEVDLDKAPVVFLFVLTVEKLKLPLSGLQVAQLANEFFAGKLKFNFPEVHIEDGDDAVLSEMFRSDTEAKPSPRVNILDDKGRIIGTAKLQSNGELGDVKYGEATLATEQQTKTGMVSYASPLPPPVPQRLAPQYQQQYVPQYQQPPFQPQFQPPQFQQPYPPQYQPPYPPQYQQPPYQRVEEPDITPEQAAQALAARAGGSNTERGAQAPTRYKADKPIARRVSEAEVARIQGDMSTIGGPIAPMPKYDSLNKVASPYPTAGGGGGGLLDPADSMREIAMYNPGAAMAYADIVNKVTGVGANGQPINTPPLVQPKASWEV